jgi:hypothetical protein
MLCFQADLPASKKQLIRPHATEATWMTAAPVMRMPRTFFRIKLPMVPCVRVWRI